mmetsp:Transcript_23198/g.48182  ORF Transcript_23198/g.48182 Transcript_23198/m.48182 type:complete len:111 (+) Transcript_23198:331-663(+)|eukprot:CAMPEP_0171328742 /NCGR_PEP_ID=MMETSP0878-20121228/827_1 /TAXON_ID=67004 /ORGANISM="Thalassiosira weissflogii, Strain CCMP1336" /LENGTH=110 /DNA_ID=CAMNT_0011828613 /DNA_START=309 /DNA_END=641 /DNA_ORIENTATION=-
MRSRILHRIPKSLHNLTSKTPSSSTSPKSSLMTMTTNSQTLKQRAHQLKSMEQRLFSSNNIVNSNIFKSTRAAIGVEGCTSALSLLGTKGAEPNLPRGWDAGVAVDDDGG